MRAKKAGCWLTVAVALGSAGCMFSDSPSDGGETKNLTVPPGEGPGTSPQWVYKGPFRELKRASLTDRHIYISVVNHTLRFTGCFDPENVDGNAVKKIKEEAFYALVTDAYPQREVDPDTKKVSYSKKCDGRQSLTVVYPIATGKMNQEKGGYNNVPGVKKLLYVIPFLPTVAAQNPSEGDHRWGGFPFLNYGANEDEIARGIAIHGPIDAYRSESSDVAKAKRLGETDKVAEGDDWKLVRGRVSLACNRMQGEHVIELTHLLGFNMAQAQPEEAVAKLDDPAWKGFEAGSSNVYLEVLDDPLTAPGQRPNPRQATGQNLSPAFDKIPLRKPRGGTGAETTTRVPDGDVVIGANEQGQTQARVAIVDVDYPKTKSGNPEDPFGKDFKDVFPNAEVVTFPTWNANDERFRPWVQPAKKLAGGRAARKLAPTSRRPPRGSG